MKLKLSPLLGMGKANDRVTILLDISKVLRQTDLRELDQTSPE